MKILVSYFSASGVTKGAATQLANLLHADLEEIIPIQKYSDEDLDWQNSRSRSSLEMKDEKSRPEIIKPIHDLSFYDVIFIGYPIWWYVEPRIIDTYLDSFNLKEIYQGCFIPNVISRKKQILPAIIDIIESK